MTMTQDETFDLRSIQRELGRLGMSGSDFAEEAGINQSTVARILSGETQNPNPLTVRAINAALKRLRRRKQ